MSELSAEQMSAMMMALEVADIEPDRPADMGEAAKFYAERLRWPIFPVHHPVSDVRAPHGLACSCGRDCASPAKHPLTGNGLLDATTDLEQIAAWWRRWPLANIGARTGTVESGGIGMDAIDIDGPEGWATWQEWKRLDAASIPPGVALAFTPGNRKRKAGRHHLVAARGTTNTARALPGIDLRGDGGYILVAPSRGITGARYTWIAKPELPR